jgi:HEPN domain-containing protein
MKTLQEKFIKRIDELLGKAKKLKKLCERRNDLYEEYKKYEKYEGYSKSSTLTEKAKKAYKKYENYKEKARMTFLEWKSNVEHLIISIVNENSVYYQNFVNTVRKPELYDIVSGIGVLRALKEDLEKGFLTSVKDLVIAEVFTDFLDMAEHLLENGYKDAAAFLIGAVLENALRKIAERHNVTVKNNDDINSLNTKLADQGVYNRIIQQQIQTWKRIRDAAAHGRFNEYNADQVKLMLEGVRIFLGEYL